MCRVCVGKVVESSVESVDGICQHSQPLTGRQKKPAQWDAAPQCLHKWNSWEFQPAQIAIRSENTVPDSQVILFLLSKKKKTCTCTWKTITSKWHSWVFFGFFFIVISIYIFVTLLINSMVIWCECDSYNKQMEHLGLKGEADAPVTGFFLMANRGRLVS